MITGTKTHRPDKPGGPINFDLPAQKEKGAPVKTRQKQTNWQDANGSLKDLQPDSSLPSLAIHKVAKHVPRISPNQLAELKKDIKALGRVSVA